MDKYESGQYKNQGHVLASSKGIQNILSKREYKTFYQQTPKKRKRKNKGKKKINEMSKKIL